MNKTISTIAVLIVVILIGGYFLGSNENLEKPLSDDILNIKEGDLVYTNTGLVNDESASLVYMREEEKLARDVYLTLYQKWGLPIFKNIASSEQTHTDSIKTLLNKYGVDDPVKNDEIGAFNNQDLLKLYRDLVSKGLESIEDALYVGALIEDLDIKDLQDRIDQTENSDIIFVYENLQRGSRNHLRSFVSQIEKYGGEYKPTYISEEEFRNIISTNRERGNR